MGWPLLLALAAASTAANYAGQKKVDKARSRTLAQELAQRHKVQQKSAEAATNTADLLVGTAAKEKAAAAAREQSMLPIDPQAPRAAGPATALDTFAPTDSAVTVDENVHQANIAREKLRTIGNARAGLEDYGNIMTGQAQAITRNQQDQAQAIDAGNNWERYVMPAKMNAAMGAGKDLFTLGDVLQLAASIYAPYGLGAKAGTAATAAEAAAKAGGSANIAEGEWDLWNKTAYGNDDPWALIYGQRQHVRPRGY